METSAATASSSRPRALDEPTLCAAFRRTVAERGDAVALRTPGGDVEVTWREYAARAADYAAGLAALGVEAGDTVAIMLTNRPEFHLVDCAAMHLRAVPFSVYNSSSPEQLEYLLGDAGNRVVICERTFLDRVLAARAVCPAVEHVVVVDGDGAQDTLTLDDLVARGEPGFDAEAAVRAVAPDDLLTLIYTSGTTGPPKGVPLTHSNLVFQLNALRRAGLVKEDDRVLLPLPLHHVYPFVGMLASLLFGLPIILPQALTGPQMVRALHGPLDEHASASAVGAPTSESAPSTAPAPAPRPDVASIPTPPAPAPVPLDSRALAARGLEKELRGDHDGALADLRAALVAEPDAERRQGIRNLLQLLDAPR